MRYKKFEKLYVLPATEKIKKIKAFRMRKLFYKRHLFTHFRKKKEASFFPKYHKPYRYITYKSYSKRFYKLKRISQVIPSKRQAKTVHKVPAFLLVRKLKGNTGLFPMSFKQKNYKHVYRLFKKKKRRLKRKKTKHYQYKKSKLSLLNLDGHNLISIISLAKRLKQIVTYSQLKTP